MDNKSNKDFLHHETYLNNVQNKEYQFRLLSLQQLAIWHNILIKMHAHTEQVKCGKYRVLLLVPVNDLRFDAEVYNN